MYIYINAKFLAENLTGIGRLSIEISRLLKKKNPNIRFVAPTKIVLKDIAKELEVISIGFLNGALWEQIELPLYLKSKGNPLLINFTSTAPIFYSNQINTICDITSLKHPEWYSKKAAFYYRILFPLISKRCKKVLTISEFVKQDLMNFLKVKEENITVIYCGVSEVFNTNETTEKIDYDFILAVGSLDPRKNLNNLIQAYLKLDNKNIKLVLIGQKHTSFAKIDFKIPNERANDIIFTGYVSDNELLRYYKNAKLFVFPSLEEGFGIPPLEAMQCGCPVAVSNTSCMPEICGDGALYFDPKSINEIKNQISNLLTDYSLKENLIEKGKLRAKKFSWSNSSNLLNELIKNDILKKNNKFV